MKSFALLTASVLLGTASAEVHKLKLNKVPLEDQLVRSGDRSGPLLMADARPRNPPTSTPRCKPWVRSTRATSPSHLSRTPPLSPKAVMTSSWTTS